MNVNDRNKVVELLKNYRSYKYAVNNGIAAYQEEDNTGMPFNNSYGPRAPMLFRGSLDASTDDYRRYSRAVKMVEGAVDEVLDDNEQDIIRLKYMNRNTLTLEVISRRKGISEKTVRTTHKRAINKLNMALRFIETPEIINLDVVISV